MIAARRKILAGRDLRIPLRLVPLEPRILLSGAAGFTFQTLASFNGTNGSSPEGALLLDSGGNLYGTAASGGDQNAGTVFELAAGSTTITALTSFDGAANGANPLAAVIRDSSGNLYGTASGGGDSNGDGTVFELPAGSQTINTLATFNGTDGSNPYGPLIMDGGGNLFGTASYGGIGGYGDGTVFEIAAGTNAINPLVSFNGTDGANPSAGLILDDAGNLYGTTELGGAYGDGTVFEVAAASNAVTTLASFNGTDGAVPTCQLFMDRSGNLYGTTYYGGAYGNEDGGYGDGTVFEIQAGSGAVTTLASFNGTNGANPVAGVIMDGSGNLFGTAYQGGTYSYGTIFEIAAGSGVITPLEVFDGSEGTFPIGDLVMDGNGNLFGATAGGGDYNDGTVYELSPTGPAAQLVFTTEPAGGVAGQPMAAQVAIEDMYGNVVTTDDSTVSLASSSGALGGTTSVAAVNGVADFSDLSLTLAGTNTLTAADNADSLSGYASNSFSITAGAPAELGFVQPPSNVLRGQTITPPVTVAVEDAFGNVVSSDNSYVTLSILSGPAGATLGGTLSEQAADGVATFSDLSAPVAGVYSLQATDGQLTPADSPDFNVTVLAQKLAFVQQPTGGLPGSTMAPAVTVDVTDASGNLASTDNSEVTLTISGGGGTLGGTTSVAALDGVATFSDLSLPGTGFYTLTAADGSLTGATSAEFGVTTVALPGNWQMAGMVSQPGTLTLDAHGGVTGGVINNNDGTSVTITGGTYSVNGQGQFTALCDESTGGTFTYVGGVNSTDDVVTLTNANPGSAPSGGVMVLNAGTFSDADLSGTWAFANASGASGSITFDGKGHVTGGHWVNSGSSGGFLSGSTYTVSSTGLVTMSLIVPEPGGTETINSSGAMNASMDVLAQDSAPKSSDLTQDTLCMMTKHTGAFAASDLSGTWSFDDNGASGTVVFNGAGKITGGSGTDPDGTAFSFKSGTYTVSPAGLVTMKFLTNDSSMPTSASGALNSSKNVLTLEDNKGSVLIMTNPSATDLVAQVGTITLATPSVPGDRGNVTVVVTNQGQVRASGSMTLDLYASTEENVADGVLLSGGVLTRQPVNLGYDQSKAYTFSNVQLPQLPAGTYYLLAVVNATQSIPESNYANDTASAAEQMVYKFGAVSARKNVILNLSQADGTVASFSLSGGGTGTVSVSGDTWALAVPESTTASALTITTRKSTAASSGLISLDGISATGSLASFSGADVNLTGSMTVDGSLGSLTLDNLSDDGGINLGGTATGRTTLAFNQVNDETLTCDNSIGSLTAASWENSDADDTDVITAPGLASASIRKGDLAANLDITGAAGIGTLSITGGSLIGNVADAGALSSLRVSGGGVLGNVSATKIGSVTVSGGNVSGNLTSNASGIGSVTVTGGDLTGSVTSNGNGNVGAITVTRGLGTTGLGGNFTGGLNLTGALASLTLTGGNLSGTLTVGGALGSLSVNKSGTNGGNVLAGAVINAGTIGTLHAAGSLQGVSGDGITLNAGTIATLSVTGDMDFTAVTIANASRKATTPALTTMSVGGTMSNSQLISDGNVSTVTVGAMENSVAFAGVDLSDLTEPAGVWELPSAPADFSGQDSIGSFTVAGLKSGTTLIESLVNSNIAAFKLGTVSLAYADGSNSGVPFGAACNQYATLSYRDMTSKTTTWRNSNSAAALPGPDGVVRVINS